MTSCYITLPAGSCNVCLFCLCPFYVYCCCAYNECFLDCCFFACCLHACFLLCLLTCTVVHVLQMAGKWNYDMTRQEAEDMQAEELLFYKRRQLQQQVEQRVIRRVEAIRRNAPDSDLDPSWHTIVEAGLPPDIEYDANMMQLKNQVSQYVKTPTKAKSASLSSAKACPHLNSGSHTDPLPKCGQSKARKRPARQSPVVPPRKRPSPEACAVPVHAEAIPVARELYAPLPMPVPATIRQLWWRVHQGNFDCENCDCPTCPFTSGGPMQQRWALIRSLVRLENWLWHGR